MNSRPRRLVALIAAGAAAALVTPALASASTYCVGSAAGSCDVQKPGSAEGLEEALFEADVSGGPDLVRIGPGTYTGNFQYASPDEVDIQGSGEATAIQGTGSAVALGVIGSGSASVVSDLEIRMASVPDPQIALGLQLGDAVAENVRVANPGNSSGNAVVLLPGGHVAGSTIRAGAATGLSDYGGASQHEVRDTFISGRVGVQTLTGLWTLERLEISAREAGVSSNATTNLRNSLVRVSGVEGMFTDGIRQFGPGVLTAEHVTVHGGPHLTYGARAIVNSGGTAALNMESSIVAGTHTSSFGRDAFGGGTANVVVGHSNFAPPDPTHVDASNGPGVLQQTPNGTNTSFDPRFVDSLVTLESPTLDFRLRYDSPLIDKGEPGGAQGLDLARATRVVNGDGIGDDVRDMGAYEYQRLAPVAAFTGPAALAAGQVALFDAGPSSDADHGDEASFSYAWDFGDGAAGSGMQSTHAYASAGAYTVTLTVTDPVGLSASATRQIEVAGPPAGGGSGGTGGGAGGAGTGGTAGGTGAGGPGTAAADTIAPALTALRARASRRGAAIRFRLSEPAAVTLRFRRRGGRTAVKRVRGGAGLNRVSRRLRSGRWRLTVTAIDQAGNRSRPRTARFRLLPR
jgi:PKD domain